MSAGEACGEAAFRAGCGVEHRHHRQPARVDDAEHADAAVVVRHVLEQPVDGVVGVGDFVDGLGVFGFASSDGRTLHDELPLGLVSATNVLKDEDVTVSSERLELALSPGLTGWRLVWRALEHYRKRLHAAPLV